METLHQPEDIIKQRYRIVAPLGQGSTGTTYEAEDLTNYQRVAIKAVSLRQATDWKMLELFEREGRVLANLNYPNIPNYLDYFYVDSSQDRIFYLVRDLVAGDSLANLVQRGLHLEDERVKEIAIQVLQTLDYLHSLNPPIIHRDIKPENLIVDRSGKVFLVDFGAVRDVYRQTVSLSNTFVGTLGYMAPEQFRGQVKPASDLYSLGATLVFVLTGRSPVDLPQVRMKIDFRNRVSISPQFAWWLDKMLEPMLEDRFTSAREALERLNDEMFSRRNTIFLKPNSSANLTNKDAIIETLHPPDNIIDRRYRIVAPLGEGSMGTTYEAQDLTNYQRVAIKAVSLPQATDWKILELFKREGRVLANLNHPNIPNYLDYFYVDSEGDRIFYLVRELVIGDSLANKVQKSGNLKAEQVQEIAVQVLQTLDYLHQLNPPIIHRNIKPENIIIDRSGQVFLVDFGAVADVYRQTISSSNTLVETNGYLAPEQLRGQVKPASDLYSLGANLVFALTGRSPVDLPQTPITYFTNRASISPQFAGWLDKMLKPILEERFTSAREALNGLNNKIVSGGKEELVESDRASSNTVSTRRRQPASSEIFVQNRGSDLSIVIPNQSLETVEGFLNVIIAVGLGLGLLVLIFVIIAIGVTGGGGIEELAMYLGVGLPLFFYFLIQTTITSSEKTVLTVNQNRINIQWIIGENAVSGERTILMREISEVGVATVRRNKRRTTACAIWEGYRATYFGHDLPRRDQEWLVEEIQSFLNQNSQ